MGVWIDTDMGFDDVAAILTVIHSGLTVDGVSLVFGNAPLAQVEKNAAGAAMAFGWDFPIYAGRASAVMGGQETAQSILGESGIPTVGKTMPEVGAGPFSGAFSALCEWLETTTSPRRILALGPLTNIAALALARPDLAAKIDDLTWMGGAVTSGNHTASAEFNAWADPEAVGIVLAHGLPLRMVDLDFCRKVQLLPEHIAPVRNAGGHNAELLADMLEGYLNIGLSRGRSSMALYDPAAAVAFVDSDNATFAPARIDVETSGHLTRGRTVVETREAKAAFNAHYAVDVDGEAACDIILAALLKEAER